MTYIINAIIGLVVMFLIYSVLETIVTKLKNALMIKRRRND